MTDVQTSTQVERARELFFGEKRDPDDWIAPHISRSWRHSLPVDIQAMDSPTMALSLLGDRREQSMRLLECAQPELRDGTLAHLAAHRWPGNVRELRSTLQAMAALAEPGDGISLEHLPAHLRGDVTARIAQATEPPNDTAAPLSELTKQAILAALADAGQNVAEAARRLGVRRSTIYRHRGASRSTRK